MSEPRIIKRYTNRKLYDTRDSRYVTLSQIAAMVRAGEDMTVIDNATKEDLTSLTLAQIIYEQEKRSAEVLPLSALRELVRRSEARIADIREGGVGRLLPPKAQEAEGAKSLLETSKMTFEEWQKRVDEHLRTLLDTLAPFGQLQDELRGVTQRIEELEKRIRKLTYKSKGKIEPISEDHPEGEENQESQE